MKLASYFDVSVGRILTIANNVFREVIRDRILYLIGLFAFVMVAALPILRQIAVLGTEKKILMDIGFAAMTFLGIIVSVFVGTGLINKEIEKKTILILIAKPISRAEFVIGKHIGLSAVLAVLVAGMTVIYLSILTFAQVTYPLFSILIATVYLFLELSLITAVSLVFGVFTSSLLATLLTLGIYVIGHLSQDVIKLVNITENLGIQRIVTGLYLIVPNLSRLDLKNQAVYGILPPTPELINNALYGVIYIILMLSISVYIFSRRQF